MSKKSRQLKSELLQILQCANVHVSRWNFCVDSKCTNVSYFVYHDNVCSFEMNIEQKKFGISNYNIIKSDGTNFSCYARPDAVFIHRPVADDILEIYRGVRLRHLIQQSKCVAIQK